MSDETLDVVKSGESVVRVFLRRTAQGLTVTVQAHPAVEEFFRMNAGDAGGVPQVIDTRVVGRFWHHPKATKNEIPPLMAYGRQQALDNIHLEGGDTVNIERLGHPLLEPLISPTGKRIFNINLSVLRLVGISEAGGVTFNVKGVYSTDAVREMKEKLAEGTKRFYGTYLKPVEMSVMCLTQEVALPGITEIRG